MNKTKIVATIGPSCSGKTILKRMIQSGVNVFRINMSHGTTEDKKNIFSLLNQLTMPNGERPCILADLAGPKIRVKAVQNDFTVKKGDKIYISSGGKTSSDTIVVSEGIKFSKIGQGATIKINDGKVQLKVVKKISAHLLRCSTIIGGQIKTGKGVNFPGITLEMPTLTPQDKKDLELCTQENVDWIALSFVRSARDRQEIERILKKANKKISVVAKIEKWEALQDLDAIIESFDGVMVARGDLGVETPPEQVPLVQKKIIAKANRSGKPVIIATQMLESMIDNPVPTRAEVSDIANAIMDGADALMVTGETAMGKYPLEVVKILYKVILETEKTIDFDRNRPEVVKHTTADAISHATCQVAQDLGAECIVTMTHSGSTAQLISRYRPNRKVIALTPVNATCRKLAMVWGITPFYIEAYNSTDDIPVIVREMLKSKNLVQYGNRYVITGGVPVGVPGTTNYLTIQKFMK